MTTDIMGEPCPAPQDLRDFDGLGDIRLKDGAVELDIGIETFLDNDPKKARRYVSYWKNCWQAGKAYTISRAFRNMKDRGMFWMPEQDEFRKLMEPVHSVLRNFFDTNPASSTVLTFHRLFNSMFSLDVKAHAEWRDSMGVAVVAFESDSSDWAPLRSVRHTVHQYHRSSPGGAAEAFRNDGWSIIGQYRLGICAVSTRTMESAKLLCATAGAMFPELVGDDKEDN